MIRHEADIHSAPDLDQILALSKGRALQEHTVVQEELLPKKAVAEADSFREDASCWTRHIQHYNCSLGYVPHGKAVLS